jgi:hypothetical protein
VKKLLLASVLAIASFPGYAHAQTLPTLTFSGCTDKNGNEGLLYWVGLEARCGLSPAKPKTYVAERDTHTPEEYSCHEQGYAVDSPEFKRCMEAYENSAVDEAPHPGDRPRVTVQPTYQGPPPIGWVWGPYVRCAAAVPVPPGCFMWEVNVPAAGLNVRTVPNGPPVMSLVNGTPLIPLQKQGDWLLVAPACDLTPTWAWSWNAGVPLNRCWVYF